MVVRMRTKKVDDMNRSFQYGLGIRLQLDDFSEVQFRSEAKKGVIASKFNVPNGVHNYTLRDLPKVLKAKYLGNSEREENSIFTATVADVFVVVIPSRITVVDPIYLTQQLKNGAVACKIVIVAQKNSKATIMINRSSLEKTYGLTTTVSVIVESEAELSIFSVENYNPDTYVFNTMSSQVGEQGTLSIVAVLGGGKVHYHHATTSLVGKGSKVNHNVVFFNKTQQFDVLTEAIHEAQGTSSTLLSRGVVENGKAIAQGKVVIGKKGSQAQGKQRVDLLLLDEKAQGEAIPILEVHNDDVTCQHGSTISRINAEQLYYVQSRGIALAQARKLITKGFLGELLIDVPQAILTEMQEILEGKQ